MAERRQLGVGHRAQIAAEDVRRAVELAVEAAEQVQEGALSASALAFDGNELAPLHRQVYAAQQLLRGKSWFPRRVPLGDAAELDRAHGATSSTSSVPPSRSANDSAAIDRRTVRSGSITCPTMERATYACGPLPYAPSGSVRSADASLPKSTRTAAPPLSYSAAASGFAERGVRRSSSGRRGPPSRYATALPSISPAPRPGAPATGHPPAATRPAARRPRGAPPAPCAHPPREAAQTVARRLLAARLAATRPRRRAASSPCTAAASRCPPGPSRRSPAPRADCARPPDPGRGRDSARAAGRRPPRWRPPDRGCARTGRIRAPRRRRPACRLARRGWRTATVLRRAKSHLDRREAAASSAGTGRACSPGGQQSARRAAAPRRRPRRRRDPDRSRPKSALRGPADRIRAAPRRRGAPL